MIVVDASVAVEFLLGRAEVIEAIDAELTGAVDEALHAPELIEPEALNALRRLTRAGVTESDQATRAVSELGQLRLIRYPHAQFRDRVWELRDNLSAYDALYLALAEVLPGSVLLTGDGGLATNAGQILRCARSAPRLALMPENRSEQSVSRTMSPTRQFWPHPTCAN